jgi:hypothetical protein
LANFSLQIHQVADCNNPIVPTAPGCRCSKALSSASPLSVEELGDQYGDMVVKMIAKGD